MKSIRYLIYTIGILLLCDATFALDVGERAPALNVLQWVRGEPVILFSKNKRNRNANTVLLDFLHGMLVYDVDNPLSTGRLLQLVRNSKDVVKHHSDYNTKPLGIGIAENIYVIFFWATWSNSSLHLLDFVEKESKLYKSDNVVFVGISKEKLFRVNNFLKGKNDINFSLGVDNKAETYDEYMLGTQGVPVFFIIGRNGKLAWKGSPFEVDRVLSRVIAGTFNTDDQNKIEELREDIRNSSHIFDSNSKLNAAKKTLAIDSTDEVAINIIVDDHIEKNQILKAIEFCENARKEAGDNKYLQRSIYYVELSIIRGMDISKSKKILNNLAKNFEITFRNSPEFLNEFVVMVLRNAPFEIRPLGELLKMAEQSVDLEKKRNGISERLGIYLQTRARVYYCIGWFTKAITTQNYAIPLLKDKKERRTALLKEKYYTEALKMNQYSK